MRHLRVVSSRCDQPASPEAANKHESKPPGAPSVPSDAVMDALGQGLCHFGPYSDEDRTILSRVLERLADIEMSCGQRVAVQKARSIGDILKLHTASLA